MNGWMETLSFHTPSEAVLPLLGVLIFTAAMTALFALLLLWKRSRMTVMMAVLSLASAAAALALCFSSPELTPAEPELLPEGDGRETAAAFLTDWFSGDFAAAESSLLEASETNPAAPETEAGRQLVDALRGDMRCELRGGSAVDGLEARHSLTLQYPDPAAMQEELRSETERVLREYSEVRPRSALAAEDGVFLPEVSDEAWQSALDTVLGRVGTYEAEAELELRLRYTPDGWRVENAPAFWDALGALYEALTQPDAYLAASREEALRELRYSRQVYKIAEDAPAGPAFDAANYVHTDDPAVIQAIADSAVVLLDGQPLCWTPETPRMTGSEMIAYCDETILIICWKEIVNNCCLSFCEVKIADASQLRRALAGGSYSNGIGPRIPEVEFARSVNAVASINGDFYDFRKLGITVYQRQLYRNNPGQVDSCFFTSSGDMLFSHRGELMGEGEAKQFVQDNDVVFSLAFGPILVENGEATHTDYYPLGEVSGHYSRSAIGQLDSLHYLLMTCGFGDWYDNVPDINQTAQYIQSKGVDKAYALDGGGTAEIVVDGRSYNYIDFDTERPMSDIIYFVTALPEDDHS